MLEELGNLLLLWICSVSNMLIANFYNFDRGTFCSMFLQLEMGREEGQSFNQSNWESSKLSSVKPLEIQFLSSPILLPEF